MAADLQFYQTNGVAGSQKDSPQGVGNGSNDWDYKAKDSAGKVSSDPVGNGEAIRAGDFSYHVYTKLKFSQPATGTQWSSISNVKWYISQLNLSGYGNGAYILASGTATYATPSNTSKSGVWDPAPTSSASGIDISTTSLANGTPGFTKFVASQLKTGATGASPGKQPLQYFTVVYDEV